jgi:pilus assembly protein Flp/PilA
MVMNSLQNGLRRAWSFVVSEDGPSATEYAIMLALIVLVAAGTIQGIGERMMNIYENIETAIPRASGS